ncbi:MAG: methylenetetrahydrofolate reductase-domain-containing protein [Piptocephalis tieghemiana]|nr:MAG: methylenetetrahydrofolate reductase-domain-containing protein [Piptocephalis tieghemiana]
MKLTTKIERATEEGRPYWSFEYFPPKTPQGVENLYARLQRMYRLGPEFIDITWGAGGSTTAKTLELCANAQTVYGLETCMHLTCTNMPRSQIEDALRTAKEAGIQNILALRGDPPRGQSSWEACDDGFSYAADLVRYIRAEYGTYFCIGVACYPEGHIECSDPDLDLKYLKEKVDAGADYLVTQFFYDTSLFLRWEKRCRAIGITIPILPGIMPIQSYGGFRRMTSLCKTHIPPEMERALEPIKNDDQAVKDYGIKQAIDMCQTLYQNGTRGFHFYTLNLEKSTRLILEGLGFIPPINVARPLPWNPSLSKKRENETVRPIFWKNHAKSYISRTENWDDFPNGRWGDARSPAYGGLDRFNKPFQYSTEEVIRLWGQPKSQQDLKDIFVAYCKGHVSTLPWSDQPLDEQGLEIQEILERINNLGYFTINSQPTVNGAKSTDPKYGWGPKGGYVYQKAYLEFFIRSVDLDHLLNRIHKDPQITYYAVNRQGNDLRTNSRSDTPCAVTWGIFPGKEVIQPTIVEAISFLAWKDEAFHIWSAWEDSYDTNSPESSFLHTYSHDCFLVNLVHNDFQNPQALYSLFFD